MSAARAWDDVVEGEPLPGFDLAFTPTRMVLQVSGTQDFYPVHHDPAFARAGGHRDPFANTGFIRAALCRLLTDWAGPAGFVRRLAFQMRRPIHVGETLEVRGRVTRRRREGDRPAVDLDVWVAVGTEIAVPGSATVFLPGPSGE